MATTETHPPPSLTEHTFDPSLKEPATVITTPTDTTTPRRHSVPAAHIEPIPIHDPADPLRKNSGDLRHLHDKVRKPEPPRKESLVSEFKGLFGRRKSKDDQPQKPRTVLGSKHISAVNRIMADRLAADPRNRTPNRRHSTGGMTAKKANVEPPSPIYLTARQLEERKPHSGPIQTHGMPALTTIMSAVEEDQEHQSLTSQLEGTKENLTNTTVPEHSEMPGPSSKQDVEEAESKAVDRPRRRSAFGGWFRNDSGKWSRNRHTSI